MSTAMDGAAPTWKVALGLLVLMGNLSWDPKRALSLMKSDVTQFGKIKLENASSYRHAPLQLKQLSSPSATPHLGSSRLWDTDCGTGAHPTASNCKCPTI